MAAATTPGPGKLYGPCVEPCAHIDCACARREAAALCIVCGEPIGYDRLWYQTDEGAAHAPCLEAREAERRSTVDLWIGKCYDGGLTAERALELVARAEPGETVRVERGGVELAVSADLDMGCLVMRAPDGEIVAIGEPVDVDTLDRWVE